VDVTADVLQARCAMQISNFFQQRRDAKKRAKELSNREV
jgi:hypothetical protein